MQDDVIICKEIILQDHNPTTPKKGCIFLSGSKLYITNSNGASKIVTSA